MSSLPKLLFVSPVFPDVTGYGLAMRAGAVLEGLSAFCQVYLLVVPIQDPRRAALAPAIQSWYREHRVIRLPKFRRLMLRLGRFAQNARAPYEWGFASRHTLHQAAQAFQGARFDYLHVFRLYMAPFAMPYLDPQERLTACYLDMDDIESITRRRLADLYHANGLYAEARREERAAEIYARLERELLPRFDGIYVCSERDKNQLDTQALAQNVFVLPNVVRPPSAARPPKSAGPFNFLFVGNLAYYPNEDAVAYFLEQVLPRLRQRTKRSFCLTVVGSGQSKRFRRCRHVPELRHVGFTREPAAYYDEADAVVVPLRAGGGTRIKVLEAFGFKRPVVSTSIGVEGLEVANEKQVLIGENPDSFAEQCYRLMEDRRLYEAVTSHAFTCLIEKYTPDVLRSVLGGCLQLPLNASRPAE
jgi:glycosyltransferase involved in cell wall biosynthesis